MTEIKLTKRGQKLYEILKVKKEAEEKLNKENKIKRGEKHEISIK